VLDFISDVGGIQGVLVSAASLFLAIWTHNDFDDFMVTRLYKALSEKTETDTGDHTESLKTRRCFSPTVYLRDCAPSLARWLCKCRRISRRERIMAYGREKLLEETSIFNMIRSFRYI